MICVELINEAGLAASQYVMWASPEAVTRAIDTLREEITAGEHDADGWSSIVAVHHGDECGCVDGDHDDQSCTVLRVVAAVTD